jgi:hypothetical protein
MKNLYFEKVPTVDNISEVIEETFGVKLDISGGWGYDDKSAVVVHSLDMPIDQFLFMFSSIRANIEMNMTLDEDDRYGGINTEFIDGTQIEINNKAYDMISFEITAMKESTYAYFIQEYKDNYGINKDFDLDEHFKKRKENTIHLKQEYWFCGLENFYVSDEEKGLENEQ